MEGEPLLNVMRGLILDDEEQADFNADPSGYMQRQGYDDLSDEDLHDAVGLVADTLPPDVAHAVNNAAAPPAGDTETGGLLERLSSIDAESVPPLPVPEPAEPAEETEAALTDPGDTGDTDPTAFGDVTHDFDDTSPPEETAMPDTEQADPDAVAPNTPDDAETADTGDDRLSDTVDSLSPFGPPDAGGAAEGTAATDAAGGSTGAGETAGDETAAEDILTEAADTDGSAAEAETAEAPDAEAPQDGPAGTGGGPGGDSGAASTGDTLEGAVGSVSPFGTSYGDAEFDDAGASPGTGTDRGDSTRVTVEGESGGPGDQPDVADTGAGDGSETGTFGEGSVDDGSDPSATADTGAGGGAGTETDPDDDGGALVPDVSSTVDSVMDDVHDDLDTAMDLDRQEDADDGSAPDADADYDYDDAPAPGDDPGDLGLF